MSKLYIGSLPRDVNEGTLRDIFLKEVGVAPRTVLVKKGGYGFIECPDKASADNAIGILNGYHIMGSQLLVEPSVPQSRRNNKLNCIQVGNVPETYPCEELNHLLSSYGAIQQCDKGASKSGNCCVYVTYETQEQAQQALSQLDGYQLEEGCILQVESMADRARGNRGRGVRQFAFSGGGSPTSSYRTTDYPLRILVLSDMVGAVIGRAGGTIRQITQQTRARVDVHRKENAGSPEKVIAIYGNPENSSAACLKILEVMQQESNNTNRGEIPLKILAHNSLVGRIIGKNGNTIKRIMEQTDTKITVSRILMGCYQKCGCTLCSSIHDVHSFNLERIVTVKGKLENISKAEQLISTKLRQSYENDMAAMAPQSLMFPGVHPLAMMSTVGAPAYPSPPRGAPPNAAYSMYGGGPGGGAPGVGSAPYIPMMYPSNSMPPAQPDVQKETVYVFIPNSAVGAIIGTGGCSIRDMISSSGATIKVSQPNKDDPVEKQHERRVTVVGTAEAQWKAQFMIFKKVGYEGYATPAEAQLRVEIFVPCNQVGRIIGKGGQNVRELQRITNAAIKFPEEIHPSEGEETPVHIIGDFYGTQAAQRQIRALVNRSLSYIQRRRPPQLQPVQN